MPRVSPALLAVALVLLAGCNGLIPQQPTPTAQTRTTTPPTTDSTTTTPTRIAPGLTESGVTDPLALAEANREILRNNTYTAETVLLATYPNGSERADVSRRTYWGSDAVRVEAIHRTDPPTWERRELYHRHDGDRAYLRLVAAGGAVDYRNESWSTLRSMPERPGDWMHRVYGLLGAANFTVERIQREGTTRYRLESTGRVRLATGYDSYANASATLWVDPDGMVREYHLEYDARSGNQTVHVDKAGYLGRIGATAVEPPAWLADAKNESVTG